MSLDRHAPRVSAIVHGLRWPEPPARDALRARLGEALPGLEILEAHEDPTHCIGAAAVMSRAASRATGSILLFLEPSILPTADDLRSLIDHAARGLAMGTTDQPDADVPAAAAASGAAQGDGGDFLAHLADLVSRGDDALTDRQQLDAETAASGGHGRAALTPTPTLNATPLWAIDRATYDALGGLDPRLWSVGVVDDLAARAAIADVPVLRVASTASALPTLTGAPIQHVSVTPGTSPTLAGVATQPLQHVGATAAASPTIIGPPAYPLRPAVARLLAIRNPLLTAFKTASADDLDEAFAVNAIRALLDAWTATGLSADAFAFGGSWGRGVTPWQSIVRRITGRSSLPVPLRDPERCLLALLAIDSVLDELPSLLDDREAWQRTARTHAHDHERLHGTDTHDGVPASAAAPPPDATRLSDASHQPEVAHSSDAGHEREVARWSDVGPRSRVESREAAPLPPRVSVVVVNWNGREYLRDCFGSLQRSDYPADRLELICVDNGSTDGSLDLLRQELPRVKAVALDRNTGFTGGNEAGVRAATGDVFVFLNNDMRVEPDCVRELVGAIDDECACTGARVLSWDGRRIDFVRGALNFEGRGFQDFYGRPNVPELATPTETFFPNGGAFAVTRDAYVRAGGFDPTFFAYYDDVDLGWRLRLTGRRIRVAGRAVVYHRHGATSRTQPAGQKRFLMDRNAFWTLMKNYGNAALRRTLGTALLLAIRRVLDESTLATRSSLARSLAPFVVRCRPRRLRATAPDASPSASPPNAGLAVWPASAIYDEVAVGQEARRDERTRAPIHAMPLEALGALCAAVDALPQLVTARAAVQQRRVVDDREILPRFGRTLELVSPFSSYRHIQQALMEAQALPELFRARTRLLIIGHEALARHISGPAVRVLEMGCALSTVARVTIATPGVAEIDDPRCTFAAYDPTDPSGLRRLAEDADVLLVQGFTLAKFPFVKALHTPIVVDLYCPFTLEHLEQTRARLGAAGAGGADPHGDRLAAAQRDANGVLAVQNEQLIDGDFFICASEAQRDFWIGALHTQGRINPLTYGDDPTLRRLIDVVPFGLPEMDLSEAVARANASRAASSQSQSSQNQLSKNQLSQDQSSQRQSSAGQPVMRGVWPGIRATDRVLLWAGSLLDWQDPLTLIRAVGELSRTRDDLKLVFMGTRHPNPLVSPMQVIDESRALAAELGLLDTHVFFNDWVPYDQRALFLREADLGLSTHRDHLETHFSFRTRMLDYIWAGLPIVCTRGDFFAGLVETRGLGLTVPPGDVSALAAAIVRLLDDEDHRKTVQHQLAAIRSELRWSRVVAPLTRYCAEPHMAADRAPALREYRLRLAQQYGGAKRLKRAALRLGLSEYQFERLKQSRLGRTAMWLHTRRAMERAKRGA